MDEVRSNKLARLKEKALGGPLGLSLRQPFHILIGFCRMSGSGATVVGSVLERVVHSLWPIEG